MIHCFSHLIVMVTVTTSTGRRTLYQRGITWILVLCRSKNLICDEYTYVFTSGWHFTWMDFTFDLHQSLQVLHLQDWYSAHIGWLRFTTTTMTENTARPIAVLHKSRISFLGRTQRIELLLTLTLSHWLVWMVCHVVDCWCVGFRCKSWQWLQNSISGHQTGTEKPLRSVRLRYRRPDADRSAETGWSK